MTAELVRRRLRAQRLIGAPHATPEAAVAWSVAVQAQDYRGAIWALAQRVAMPTAVEDAVARGAILRSWPMRGTLHFVAPADLRWLLALLAPRAIAKSAGRLRELELDARTLERAGALVQRELAGATRTRDELYTLLTEHRISPAGQRGIHILGYLAQRGVIVLAPPRGKQATFGLVDDFVPATRTRDADEALAELARRYVASHGPVLLDDFVWWSGLTVVLARRALELAEVETTCVGDATYYAALETVPRRASTVHLLPAYDEYTVAYRDRSLVLRAEHAARAKNGIFAPVILVDGVIAGTWARTVKRTVAITAELFEPASDAVHAALEAAATRYGDHLGLAATLSAPRARSPARARPRSRSSR